MSVSLAIEYESSCGRAEHVLAAGLTEEDVEVFVDGLITMAEPVETRFLWRPQLRDPGDELVLEAAINGRAGALVTFNVGDYGNVPERFGIALLTPGEALRRISN